MSYTRSRANPMDAGPDASSGVPGAQERPHEEIGLIGPVGVFCAYRAGAARAAAEPHAIRALRARQMTRAGGDLVAGVRECADRTGFQAPSARARIAWA